MLGAPASSSRLAGLPGDVAQLGAGRGEMDRVAARAMIFANPAGELMVSARTSSGPAWTRMRAETQTTRLWPPHGQGQ